MHTLFCMLFFADNLWDVVPAVGIWECRISMDKLYDKLVSFPQNCLVRDLGSLHGCSSISFNFSRKKIIFINKLHNLLTIYYILTYQRILHSHRFTAMILMIYGCHESKSCKNESANLLPLTLYGFTQSLLDMSIWKNEAIM